MSVGVFLIICGVVASFSFAVGSVVGYLCCETEIRSAACKAGVAKWVTDPETGEAKFRWVGDLDDVEL